MQNDTRPDIIVMMSSIILAPAIEPISSMGFTTVNDPNVIDTIPAADPGAVLTKRTGKYKNQEPGTSMHPTKGPHGAKDRCHPREKTIPGRRHPCRDVNSLRATTHNREDFYVRSTFQRT